MDQKTTYTPKTHSRSDYSENILLEARDLVKSLAPIGRPLKEMYGRKIICFDFDGTLHVMRRWYGASICDGAPVSGAIEMLHRVLGYDYSVAIYSTRSHQLDGRAAMCDWISRWGRKRGLHDDLGSLLFYPIFKPPAWVTFDDRAVTADGVRTWDAWTEERFMHGIRAALELEESGD